MASVLVRAVGLFLSHDGLRIACIRNIDEASQNEGNYRSGAILPSFSRASIEDDSIGLSKSFP